MQAQLVRQTLPVLADELSGALRNEADALHLLADQSGLPNIRSIWPSLRGASWQPVLGLADDQPDGASPLLIDVSSLTSDAHLQRIVRWLYDQGRFANCLCLLRGPLAARELATRLRERTEAQLPDRLTVVLRYFDTRALPLLPKLLSGEQFSGFMSCVDDWYFVDRQGQTMAMPMPGDRAGAPFSPPVFDEAQERLLMDDGLADAVLDQLLDQRHPALRQQTPPQQYLRVAGLVESARRYGIDDVADATRYCFAAFEHGDDFDTREPWSSRIASVRRGQAGLKHALRDGT